MCHRLTNGVALTTIRTGLAHGGLIRGLIAEQNDLTLIQDLARLAFNLFRLAAIFHGIKGRVLRGTAANAQAAERAKAFPRLAQLAREATPIRLRTSRP